MSNYITIKCDGDGCSEEASYKAQLKNPSGGIYGHRRIAGVRDQLERQGWTRGKPGLDYCPDCSAKKATGDSGKEEE